MNCQNHPEIPATAYCRTCGKPVCDECRRDAFGTVYCAEHAPAPAAAPPARRRRVRSAAPSAAAIRLRGPARAAAELRASGRFAGAGASSWALFPGVGAIYNGQYAKGFVHAVIWGILMQHRRFRRGTGLEPVFGMLVAAWWFYMAFEAYHTARKRRAGEPVDEYSSILNLAGGSTKFRWRGSR